MRRRHSPTVKAALRSAEAVLPASGEIDDFLGRLSETRGRPVAVLEVALSQSVSGALVSTKQADYIVVPDDASPERTCSVVCHEVAHMLLGHDAQPNAQSIVDSGLLDALDPKLIRSVIAARHGYAHPEEADAEIVATYLSVELRRRILRGGYTYYDDRWR